MRWLAVFCLALLAACSPLAVVNGVTPSGAERVETDQAYGAEPRHGLDVYHPKVPKVGAPVLMFFYGGSWQSGDRGDYAFVGETLTSLGYTVVIPDYRLYPEVRFPAFVEDAALAFRWVQDNLDRTDNGVVPMGHSAGAQIVGLLALDERYLAAAGADPAILRAWIGLAGPYGFSPLKYAGTREVFEGLADADLARPIHFACERQLPALLLHGEDDSTVLPRYSAEMAEAMRSCGTAVKYQPLTRVDHYETVLGLSSSLDGLAPVLPAVDAFLSDMIP